MIAVPVDKHHIEEVYEMLQSISKFYPDKKDFSKIWLDFNSQEHVFGFLFKNDDQIIGYGAIIYEIKIRGGKAAHIEDIVVNFKHRGEGYGKQIIEHLIKSAYNSGCYKISLSCKPHNNSFYESCGFTQDGNTFVKML
jgi:predicted GNAT family N-acyltransferase